MKKFHLPQIGLRIIKSAIAVFLTFLVYFARGRTGAPLYAAIAALWCMRQDASTALQMGKQRSIGTFVGGFFGAIIVLARAYLFQDNEYITLILSAIMIIPVIYFTVVFNQKNISYFSCVVFLSVAVARINMSNPFVFVTTRIFETLMGTAIGIFVNFFRFPKKYDKSILFVSDIRNDDAIYGGTINNYTKFELNRMLSRGLNFTISTSNTPASLYEQISDVRLSQPAVVMDGASLYDFKTSEYINPIFLNESDAEILNSIFKEHNITPFISQLFDNTLIIFHGKLKNKAEIDAYNKNKTSPYRNYIQNTPHKYSNILYYMAIDRNEKINYINERITKALPEVRTVIHKIEGYNEYTHIRIYSKKANQQKSLEQIKNMNDLKKIINYSDASYSKDNKIKNLDYNIKLIKQDFEKSFLKKS